MSLEGGAACKVGSSLRVAVTRGVWANVGAVAEVGQPMPLSRPSVTKSLSAVGIPAVSVCKLRLSLEYFEVGILGELQRG